MAGGRARSENSPDRDAVSFARSRNAYDQLFLSGSAMQESISSGGAFPETNRSSRFVQ
jgi:hypothetical protein